ncbi:MAG: hypothetical protein ACHQ1G_03260 [Planctomycetota bacterium]
MKRLPMLVFALWIGCGREPSPAVPPDPEMEAARVLLRHARARIDGVMPPPSWPEPKTVRRVGGGVWTVDIDTSRLPGGYPGRLVVEVSGAGGHTGRPMR